MPIKTLKTFQQTAIDSAVEVFSYAKKMLDAAGDDAEGRSLAIHDNGYLLIEAPTGAGKTLMAGNIAERMASLDDVVWFWFAPFKGVVDQTAAFLREQFAGLRLRTLAEDRNPTGTRKGDVFVTTWQMVATKVKDRRNVRKSGEQNPSIDELIATLREQGLRIGVVVDEAHHGFHGQTQAAEFFRAVLRPEYTILVTATPDDADLEDLRQRMQIERIHRIGVSRADAVGDVKAHGCGLIKSGIKCVAWMAEERSERLVDFETTALREGANVHRLLKAQLEKAKISLTPLMLVQVASNEKSVERAKEKLVALGFTEQQIAVHTAEEPDANLLALANDESREVLIFKMAVALGFDAPRAWTLVSMRAAKDPDFGVQLVGRILRVHRRLQGKKVPEALQYGYVLLADCESQSGIDAAGQRINQMRTQYARLSPTTVVVRVAGHDTVQYVGPSGQLSMLSVEPPPGAIWQPPRERAEAGQSEASSPWVAEDLFQLSAREAEARGERLEWPIAFAAPAPNAAYRYPLRAGVPRQFKTHGFPEDFEVTEEQCAAKFVVSADDLLQAMLRSEKVKLQKRTLDVFTHAVQMELAFIPPSPLQMRILSQRELMRSEVFDPKCLRQALLRQLKADLLERGCEDATDAEKLAHFLDVLLATRPELLREAQKQALAQSATLQDAEPLPDEVQADEPLASSRNNVYGAMPRMNNWEREFGEYLDADTSGAVLWWHRNPDRKPWSVRVLLVDGRGFYPDFVVGISHRPKVDQALLADTKFAFDMNKEMPKILAEHPGYGSVLILSKNPSKEWAIARMDTANFRAVLGNRFRLADASHY